LSDGLRDRWLGDTPPLPGELGFALPKPYRSVSKLVWGREVGTPSADGRLARPWLSRWFSQNLSWNQMKKLRTSARIVRTFNLPDREGVHADDW